MLDSQKAICVRFDSEFVPCLSDEKVGIAIDTLGQLPINGVRHRRESGTCGWYFWCGRELSSDLDFFKPLHYIHLTSYLPQVIPYMALAPGYRILIATGYEDVWYDQNIFRY